MRRSFQALFVGCLLLTAPAVAATSSAAAFTSPDPESPSSSAASPSSSPASLSTAYNLETDRQFRVGLQMRLAWTGDYSGPFDGEIDAASLRAIRDFQARHGMAATGIIDEPMLRRLIDLSDRAESATGFKLVDDATTGARIALPLALVEDGGATEVGRVWRSADRRIEIEAVHIAGPGTSLDELFDVLRGPTDARAVTDATLTVDGFTIAGTESGQSYLMRFGGTDGDIRGYVVSFDPAAEAQMRPFVTVAMNLFDPAAAASDLRLVGRGDGETSLPAALESELPRDVSAGEPALLNAGIAPEPDADLSTAQIDSSGTGFVVSDDGWLLTNAHVARACRTILVGSHGAADKLVIDEVNDLALVHVDAQLGAPLPIATEMPRLGEDILALGYPLRSILADSLNVTRGNVSSLLGLMNDARYLQISAPVQPGNSGGPLLDLSGRVVGVVTAKLNAVAIADATGDIPQSINFAIRPDAAVRFLKANAVDFTPAPAGGEAASVADTTERAQAAVVPILCVGESL